MEMKGGSSKKKPSKSKINENSFQNDESNSQEIFNFNEDVELKEENPKEDKQTKIDNQMEFNISEFGVETKERRFSRSMQTYKIKGEGGTGDEFQCPACKKKFYQSGNLKVHLRIHTREKLFICPIKECAATFTALNSVKRHYARFHSHLGDWDNNTKKTTFHINFFSDTQQPEVHPQLDYIPPQPQSQPQPQNKPQETEEDKQPQQLFQHHQQQQFHLHQSSLHPIPNYLLPNPSQLSYPQPNPYFSPSHQVLPTISSLFLNFPSASSLQSIQNFHQVQTTPIRPNFVRSNQSQIIYNSSSNYFHNSPSPHQHQQQQQQQLQPPPLSPENQFKTSNQTKTQRNKEKDPKKETSSKDNSKLEKPS